MKFIKTEVVNNDQILLVKDELLNLYFVAVERIGNYYFNPHFQTKAFKTKATAIKHFNNLRMKYKANKGV